MHPAVVCCFQSAPSRHAEPHQLPSPPRSLLRRSHRRHHHHHGARAPSPPQSGLAGLRPVLPTLAVYALSFAFTAIYWINHHHLVHRTQETDQAILYANLFFLFCLSLLPFFTSYLLEMKLDSFSVALYAASMVVTGFSFMLLRLSIVWRLRRSGSLQREDQAATTNTGPPSPSTSSRFPSPSTTPTGRWASSHS